MTTIATTGGVATARAAVSRLAVQNVIVAFLHRLGREQLFELALVLTLITPLFNGVVHHALDLNVGVDLGGMVQSTEDIVDNLVVGHTRVLPCVNNSPNYEG